MTITIRDTMGMWTPITAEPSAAFDQLAARCWGANARDNVAKLRSAYETETSDRQGLEDELRIQIH